MPAASRTQNVQVTVVGTNDAPFYICGPQTEHLVEGQNVNSSGNLHADGDLLFTDIDLSDAHTVSTTVTATRSGGGAVPLTNAQLIAAFATSLTPDSTGHLIGDVDWNFMLNNNAVSFLNSGETLTLVYHVAVNDASALGLAGRDDHDPRHQRSRHHHQRPGIGLGVRACGHHRLGGDRHHDHGAGRNA